MLNLGDFLAVIMLYNIKVVYLHCVFHGIRFKVNEDWVSGKIPFFFFMVDEKKRAMFNEHRPSFFMGF